MVMQTKVSIQRYITLGSFAQSVIVNMRNGDDFLNVYFQECMKGSCKITYLQT